MNYEIDFGNAYEAAIFKTDKSVDEDYVYKTFSEAKKALLKMFSERIASIKRHRDEIKHLRINDVMQN